METINQNINTNKFTSQKKKKENRIQSVYSRCLITRKVILPITNIGKNINLIFV